MVDAMPELILAMDTSGDVCSVAVMRGCQFVSENTFRHGMHLSERLLDHVSAVLQDADASPDDIDLYAVGVGPGSFTGTRIGVMTMKTFASVRQKPLYGVDSLGAIARCYAYMPDTIVIPMHPCRAGIVYTGGYDVSMGYPFEIISPGALSIADLTAQALASIKTTLVFCGTASIKYRKEITASLGVSSDRAVFGEAVFPRAAEIAAMAMAMRASGAPSDDPLALVPHYISPPPITMPKSAANPALITVSPLSLLP